MNVRVDPNSPIPPSRQLVQAVLDAVATGELRAGDRLPSVRRLAADALVNPNTVQRAFRDLEHLAVTEGRNGSGVYVRADGEQVAKALRLGETLDEFRRAAELAVRAGHAREVLGEVLEQAVRGGRGAVPEKDRAPTGDGA